MSAGPLTRLARNVGGKIKTSLAVVGAAAAAGSYLQYKALFLDVADDDKKKVLVIPFHRLIIKDQIQQDFASSGSFSTDKDERPIEMATRDLVDLIHAAASDPNIVGLYGIFGHGSVLPTAGWADLEEIREALKVFKEAHRVHLEPNVDHSKAKSVALNDHKPLYAYADNFSGMTDPANKDYYLASMFTHVHMQDKGELNLHGMIASQLFFKDALSKYGIKLHVFKHGDYKNFPNMFTEKGFNKPHREAMSSILSALQTSVCNDISESRSQTLYSAWVKKSYKHENNDLLWKRIFQTGSFPAEVAVKAGFVDSLPARDPLLDLLATKTTDTDESKSVTETGRVKFNAEDAIGLASYKKLVDKKKQSETKRKGMQQYLDRVPFIKDQILALTGQKDLGSSQDKIALVYVQGAIGDASARKTVNSLRKIAEDKANKAVVLRVNSPGGAIFACETISQEIKRLGLPVIVSFGNTAASGGYYVSAQSDRIFASNKTLTGSIGIFGVRADLTGLAKQYGVSSDSIATGELAGLYSSMEPMSRKMQKSLETTIARYYDQFKAVVSTGRGMDVKAVEKIAQGRVWTGEQARLNGLVDDTGGGLFRALAYAERIYTSGDAEVVAWPRKLSFWERLQELAQDDDPRRLFSFVKQYLSASPDAPALTLDQTLDVAPIVRSLLSGSPPTLSGIYMTCDENTAIQCLVEQTMSPVSQPELNRYFTW